jgi:hypothetical protein
MEVGWVRHETDGVSVERVGGEVESPPMQPCTPVLKSAKGGRERE